RTLGARSAVVRVMATSDRSGPRVLLGAALVLALAACAPMPPATPDRPSSAPSVTSSALVLVDVDGSGMGLRGRLVDPRTLSDVAGKPVLSLGHNYTEIGRASCRERVERSEAA